MISVINEMYSPDELKNKSLSDLKRDYVKNVQTYLSTVPASVRRREDQKDNSQKATIDHQMKNFSNDLKSQGKAIKPGFMKPESKTEEVH